MLTIYYNISTTLYIDVKNNYRIQNPIGIAAHGVHFIYYVAFATLIAAQG